MNEAETRAEHIDPGPSGLPMPPKARASTRWTCRPAREGEIAATRLHGIGLALVLLIAGKTCFAALQYGIFVVHCEPLIAGEPQKIAGAMNLQRPAKYWNALNDLVTLAQDHSHCLTIMFNPQWAVYAALLPDRRLQVAGWTAAGHELAVHHHGKEALDFGNEWDGFSNNSILAGSSNFFGDIPFMMTQGIYTNHTILSATTEDGDWPEGVLYQVAGGKEPYINLLDPGDLVSSASPACMAGLVGGSLQNNGVWMFRMRLFTEASTQTQVLQETQNALLDCAALDGSKFILGYVTHAKNFYDTRALGQYEELFSQLTNASVSLIAASNAAALTTLGTPVPAPQITLESAATNIAVTWDTTRDGLIYQLQHSTCLVNPTWTNCTTSVIGNGSNYYETVAAGTSTAGYFRVTVSE